MQAAEVFCFGIYRLDPTNRQLWRRKRVLKLTHKAFQVLHYLVEHAGQLVTKDTLFQAVWPATVVTDSALTVCIKELRKTLGDDPHAPKYIETVHRRGYRFIAQAQRTPSSLYGAPATAASLSLATPVGRETELAQLTEWYGQALRGQRHVVFVTGEAGIGKTTVVEAFVAQARTQGPLRIGQGQCIEQYGAGEAYLPVLEAFGRLCKEPGGKRVSALLERHAPTWLVQMPGLVRPARWQVLQQRGLGATKERMLREMAEALEVMTAEQPLVLVLEDLHWSDTATLELLAVVARRREAARLLVLGTYRPVEVLVRGHPLIGVQHELQLHGHCQEMRLDFLTVEGVAAYLAKRFGALPAALACTIHQRTGGNPLFMVSVVDYMIAQGLLSESEDGWTLHGNVEAVAVVVPENLRQMIAQQLERLAQADQHILESASAVGVDFSAAAVAAGLETGLVQVEERCEALVRRKQFLQASGIEEWPDGTVASRYRFMHALYQDVVYGRLTGARRIRLHQHIGERQEAGYRERAGTIAAELAVHFERGRDYRRAVQYLGQAGENASQRSAFQEAIALLTRGLTLLQTLPDTPVRIQQELTLQSALGKQLIATKGFAAPEVGAVYTRAWALCQQAGDTLQCFPVLLGMWNFYLVRAALPMARALGEQCLSLAQSISAPVPLLGAHRALGATLYWLGEFAAAQEHLTQGLALYDFQQHHALAFVYGVDPGVGCLSIAAWTLWFLGYPEQALQRVHETLTLAKNVSHPFSLAFALNTVAILHQLRREVSLTRERAEAVMTLSAEQGFPFTGAWGTVWRGWALAEQGQVAEGMAQITQSLTIYRGTGAELVRPYHLALLAEAYRRTDQPEEGLTLLAEALILVHTTGERWYEAELYRLRGELTLQREARGRRRTTPVAASRASVSSSAGQEASRDFQQALAIARQQSAKSLELRTAMSLARLWQRQGKRAEARALLAPIYGWFTEGFDTPDLQEAKVLLEALC